MIVKVAFGGGRLPGDADQRRRRLRDPRLELLVSLPRRQQLPRRESPCPIDRRRIRHLRPSPATGPSPAVRRDGDRGGQRGPREEASAMHARARLPAGLARTVPAPVPPSQSCPDQTLGWRTPRSLCWRSSSQRDHPTPMLSPRREA